jgi:hypothetical protein
MLLGTILGQCKPSNADTRDDLSLLDLRASLYLDNKRWMRPSLSHPLKSRRLLVAGSVSWIVSGLDLRESLHADGVDLRDPVLERGALDLILDLAIPQGSFQGDELPILEHLGELREIPPGIDAMPFGAGFVVAFVVLPAFVGCDVEDDVLAVVLSGFGFRVLSEAADEDDFVEHGVWLRFFSFVRCLRYMLAQRVCRCDPLPRRLDRICGKGPQLAWGKESAPPRGA